MPLTIKGKEEIMEIKKIETVVLSIKERSVLGIVADDLDGICGDMVCGGFDCNIDCPLRRIAEKARDLSAEIKNFLLRSK